MRILENNYVKILFIVILFSMTVYVFYTYNWSGVYRYTIRNIGYKIDKTFIINKGKNEFLKAFDIESKDSMQDSLFQLCYRNDDEIIFSVLVNINTKGNNTTIIKLDSLLRYSYTGKLDSIKEQKMADNFNPELFGDLFEKLVIKKLNKNEKVGEHTFLYNYKTINN